MTTAPATTAPVGRTTRVPAYPVLVGIAYGVCVVGMSTSIAAEMVFGYTGSGEQPRSLGEQLAGVVGFGTLALLVSVLSVRLLRSERQRQVGAIVLGIAAVPALAFFWCGMPAILGAAAAALAGLTRGRTPVAGAARVFGLIGLAFAVINPIANFLGVTISWIVTS
ncbi:hypothetical protein GCM10011376_00360 [Nocardioides flavus (ex Wang et al. 2016)]|uniref:DUF4190 domain-containing protein n=1 Tax=Nocardioides flavus (ex Wang et al. 2016) TaxID=2058780 RepID=A0ABQ3HDU9_9ACTN|nr:hypothetical protein [Nocardioides flavus (ex Wang et al. 2016)]GHE14866.1 hypothetical protein GCM10011376_00360 [Nocardioides flavus (ex Wang et al. 2016)]